jgi:hypothetical protein
VFEYEVISTDEARESYRRDSEKREVFIKVVPANGTREAQSKRRLTTEQQSTSNNTESYKLK